VAKHRNSTCILIRDQCPDAEQWKHAALEELNAHSTNDTWKLVPRPAGKKVIGSKWVFKVKRNADGSIERYKGRVVAKGFLALTTLKSSPLLSGCLPFE
jgi:hypothetical protein